MAIVVEHEKRKKQILEKALELFIEEGYEDVTFQKIADRCGITRTTLYIYFKSKRDIFTGSIKQLGDTLENSLNLTVADENLSVSKRLKKVLLSIYDVIDTHQRLFTVLLTYLLQIQKTGIDPAERVLRRTLKLRHVMSSLVIEGMKSGEFKQTEVRVANEVFYGLLESSIFRFTIMKQTKIPEFEKMVDLAISGIQAKSE